MESIQDLQRKVMAQAMKDVSGGAAAFLGGSAALLGGSKPKRRRRGKNKNKPKASKSLEKKLDEVEKFTDMQNLKIKNAKGGAPAFLGGKRYQPQKAVLGGGNVEYLDKHADEEAKDNAPADELPQKMIDAAVEQVLRDMDPTQEVKGGNWWKDFKQGFAAPFKSIVKPAAKLAKELDVPGADVMADFADVAGSVDPGEEEFDGRKFMEDKRYREAYDEFKKKNPKWSKKKLERETKKRVDELAKYDYKGGSAAFLGGAKPKQKPKRKASDKMKRRAALVKKVMKEHSLNLPAASKYVKEKGLKY